MVVWGLNLVDEYIFQEDTEDNVTRPLKSHKWRGTMDKQVEEENQD